MDNVFDKLKLYQAGHQDYLTKTQLLFLGYQLIFLSTLYPFSICPQSPRTVINKTEAMKELFKIGINPEERVQ